MKRKLNTLKYLMIFAELVLIGFVVQWVFSKYNEEKARLSKELFSEFRETHNRLSDSIITQQFINPNIDSTFKTGKNIKITIRNTATQDINEDTGCKITRISALPVKHDLIFDSVAFKKDSLKMTGTVTQKLIIANEADFLVRSVGLFVKQIKNKVNFTTTFDSPDILLVDTTIFKKELTKSIHKVSPSFVISWSQKQNIDTPNVDSKELQYSIIWKDKIIEAKIENYNWFVIKTISAQIIFVLFLILLTGVSFYIAYRSLKKQMQLNILRDDFVRNISHELKTPVTTVKVAIEALQNFNLKENEKTAKEYLSMANSELQRLETLVNKVLISMLYAEQNNSIQPEKTDLNILVEEVLTTLTPQIDKENARINFTKSEKPLFVNIDKFHITGVILNLLDNSFKYTHQTAEIDMLFEETTNYVILKISDRGVGIPEEYLKKIFEKFFRIPQGDVHNVKGYGLGLNYSAMIMQLHHGKIEAQNRQGGGTEFILKFYKNE